MRLKSLPNRSGEPESEIALEGLPRDLWIAAGVCLILTSSIITWAAVAPFSAAIIAPGFVLAESAATPIHIADGGTITEIAVVEGAEVKKGDLLFRIDGSDLRKSQTVFKEQLAKAYARRARLEAERDDRSEFEQPPQLSDQLDIPIAAVETERGIFVLRRAKRQSVHLQSQQTITELKKEIAEYAVEQVQLADARGPDRSLISTTDSFAERVAQASEKIAKAEFRILQDEEKFRSEVARDLRSTADRISAIQKEKNAVEERLKRLDVRAPRGGIVRNLPLNEVDSTINPGETVLTIESTPEDLIIEAHVQPKDVDQMLVGEKAYIRFTSLNRRTTPELEGTIAMVGSELVLDPPSRQAGATAGQPYSIVRIQVAKDQLLHFAGLKLMSGLPAEVFIPTRSRTPFSYIVKPLRDQLTRTFRES